MKLIDADALKKKVWISNIWTATRVVSWDDIENAAPVDASPVVHAEWEEPFPYANGAICSQCETHSTRKSKYCPECGAKMDWEEQK